jgi:signal transduction histidine kinase
MALQPLSALRRRLTLWYTGTFGGILLLLGTGLFWVIHSQVSQRLDASLADATKALRRAAEIRELESAKARGDVVDAVDELHIPDRSLYLFDGAGNPLKPAVVEPWVAAAARRAVQRGAVDEDFDTPRELRLHGERFRVGSGTPYVAVVVGDRGELEEEYASLLGAFGVGALLAVVLVAAGGTVLVRLSTAPVEEAMEHMRRFMADAAHELRTPVTVLRTRAEVTLQQRRDPDEYERALQSIAREAERLAALVGDLLLLARADAGERLLRRERLFLDDIALDAAGAARVMAEPRAVSIEVGDVSEAPIEGDRQLVRQLLMIVLDNAVKFTPSGGRVRLSVATQNGHSVAVIDDTGSGIPPEQLPHVFERFFRGDPARGRAEGAGLGLSIARWIAQAHDADIGVDSEVGRGTTVTIRFPSSVSST